MSYYQISNHMINSYQIEEVKPIQEVREKGDPIFQFAIILKNKEIVTYSRHIEEADRLLIRLEMEELFMNIRAEIERKEVGTSNGFCENY